MESIMPDNSEFFSPLGLGPTGKPTPNASNRMTGPFKPPTALANGVAVTISMMGASLPATVWVNAVAGDTVKVSYSLDGINYSDWPKGDVVGVASNDVLDSGVHSIKFQRTAGAGVTSTYGVI